MTTDLKTLTPSQLITARTNLRKNIKNTKDGVLKDQMQERLKQIQAEISKRSKNK